MIRMIEPDYKHFTRLETIYADEAEWLLAVFELREKEFSDKDIYEAHFNEQRRLAGRVLCNALGKHLEPICNDPDAISFDDYGKIDGYVFSLTRMNFVSFCSWALELKYNLPDVLVTFVNGSDCNKVPEEQGNQIAEDSRKLDESQKTDEAPVTEDASAEDPPETDENQADDDDKSDQATFPANATPDVNPKGNKGGKPKGYLSEAVEHVYNKIIQQDKPGLLKPSKIREFIIYMKEMATKGNRYADEYVMARIKSIQAPEEGACVISTEDNVKLTGQNETIVRGKQYTNNDVAKILTKLRKK